MRSKYFIKFTAVFLLIVFSLNTVVGFACSAGVDMGFNSKHHHHDDDDIVLGTQTDPNDHHEMEEHHHHHELTRDQKGDDDNCCDKGVAEFSQSDKMLSHLFALETQTQTVFNTSVSYYLSELEITASKPTSIRVIRSFFFTLPDIRVSIQSFQI